ncbi:MAG: IS21 family transposase [Candidatus Desulfofervidus sp.]|nr:IS21 family transposase [Candidatus Desulfofervidus sp.]
MNIETWAYIRHLFLVEKLPKKVIARKLGMDTKTVRNALKKDTFSSGHSRPQTSKLDDFKERINDMFDQYPGISAVRIYEEIRKMDYTGGISILRNYLRTLRPPSKTFLHITTLPGEEAQVDWAYAGTVPNGESSQRMYCFLMVLSFSSMLYLEFFPSQTMENFTTGHVNAFHFFEGVPKKIRYDNLKSVVLSRIGSKVQFNPRFMDFANHYLFDASPCNVRSPHEKGRVERAVRYVKKNFLAGRTFKSITDCNLQAASWRDQIANCRIHGATKRRPVDLFKEKEPSLLTNLPAKDYDTRCTCFAKSTSQCLVKFDTNRYSVPVAYASRMLTLKADDQFVSIYDKEHLVFEHKRVYLKHQTVEDPKHVKERLSSRPQAYYFKHRDLLFAMGDTARQYIEAMTKTELSIAHQVKKIVNLVELFGKTEVLAAMEHALKYNALGYEYLRNIILANRRKRSATQTPGFPSSKINPDLIRSTWVEEKDPAIYDNYFNVEETDHED